MSREATRQQTWLKQQTEAKQNQQGTWDIPKGIKLLLAETVGRNSHSLALYDDHGGYQ